MKKGFGDFGEKSAEMYSARVHQAVQEVKQWVFVTIMIALTKI